MQVCVTGAAGFICSHLTERLVSLGYNVFAVDDLSRGSIGNLKNVIDNINFKVKDVSSDSFVLPQVDMVFHLAADSIIEQDNPISYMRNVKGMMNILEQMRLKDVNKIVFSSSASVYGGTKETLSPNLFYGASKLACESLINVYASKYGFQSWVYRFGNIIGGPNEYSRGSMNHGCILDFLNQIKIYGEVRMHGDGSQVRSFVYVEDLIDALITSTSRECGIYNVANEDNMTVNNIINIISDVMNMDFEVKHLPRWQGDADFCSPDSSKLRATGWKTRFSSREAVRKTVQELLGEI